ncbi:MAG: HD family phosphohydrolase [Candidatus Aminicenantaceae bacterium]
MNFFSTKKIKLFKSTEPLAQKQNTKPVLPKKEKKQLFTQKIINNPFIFIFIFILIFAYFISYLPSKSLPLLKEEEIAPSDIVAPEDLTIEDKETTEKRRIEAVEAVLPVYNHDQNVFLNTEEKIREFFSLGREWLEEKSITAKRKEQFRKDILDKFGIGISPKDINSLVKFKFDPKIEESLINLISKISDQGIILSKNLFIHGEQERGLTLIKSPESEKNIRVDDILDTQESKQILTAEINKLELSQSEKSILITLSHLFISPNISYNRVETEARKDKTRAGVETVFYTIKKGKVIIRKGDEVNEDTLKQIKIINQNLKAKPSWLTNFLGTFLLFGLLFISLWYYLKSLLKFRLAMKNFLMMGVTLLLSLLFYKLSIFLANIFSQNTNIFLFAHAESYRYAFPYQFGVLLFAFLTTNHLAIIFAFINSLLVGYLFKANFYLMTFTFLGGLAAIYGIKYYQKQKRSSTLRAGIFVIAPINIFVIIIIHLIKEILGPLDLFTSEVIMGLLGGILGATVAFLFLPVFEYIFNIITQTKLLELTNSDLPIFRRMAIEAPGSYHHSLIVASLAEEAAEKIKLDTMLVKAGSLYHDIGKIKRPEYFIENQTINPDRHKDLTPSMSTLVIINHVKEGVELAKKLRLPHKIREIIAHHHGNSLVRYFFQKAKEKYDPEMHKVGEESYRYPGPAPQSKEAALILLADSVEAASRSLSSPSRENLKRVIKNIFENYLQDGQLDDCDFSLKELRTIASSFLSTLYTIYHPRPEYPGFDFELKKNIEKKQKSNDRNLKSSAKILDKSKKV